MVRCDRKGNGRCEDCIQNTPRWFERAGWAPVHGMSSSLRDQAGWVPQKGPTSCRGTQDQSTSCYDIRQCQVLGDH